MLSPFAIAANRTRAVISPNQAHQALAWRQPHSLVGPQASCGAASWSKVAGFGDVRREVGAEDRNIEKVLRVLMFPR